MMCMRGFNCVAKINQALSAYTSVLFVNLFNRFKLKFNAQLCAFKITFPAISKFVYTENDILPKPQLLFTYSITVLNLE